MLSPAHGESRNQNTASVLALLVHDLGEAIGLVSLGLPNRPHLEKVYRKAHLRDLPCSLGPGQSAADDRNRFAHWKGL